MGRTCRSTMANFIFESITMLDRLVNSSRILLSYPRFFIAQWHSPVFFYAQGWPNLLFQRLLQGIGVFYPEDPADTWCWCSFPSGSFLHCQSLKVFQALPVSLSLQNAQVSRCCIVVGNINTICGFYAGEYSLQHPTQAQVWWSGFHLKWVLSLP